MAKRNLGSATLCRLPSDLKFEQCGTVGKTTLCVGDRVQRTLKGHTHRKGTVLAVHPGTNNSGKKKLAARVCFDTDEKNDLAYPYLFDELKKAGK